ncbi:MAG TPA: M12 family metallo-peptidase, partial [Emticicia sp.]
LNAQKNFPDVPTCGTIEDAQSTEAIMQMMKKIALKNTSKLRTKDFPMRECLIAVSVDKTLFDFYMGDKEIIRNRVYELFSQVSALYEKELGIKITVSHIEFWENRAYTNLSELDQYWATISQKEVKRDLVHLLKTDNVDRGAAGIGYLGYGVASTGFANYSSAVLTIAHEIGHNLSSPHTHSCLWPGGPIDWCSYENGIKEGCMDYESSQSRIGTVMSYCGNRKLSFHPLCIELMKGWAEDVYGFPIINNVPANPAIASENLQLTNLPLTPFLNWNYSSTTDKYRIQVSETANFSSVVNDSTLAYNQFQAYNLKPETKYYWRVKARNTKGESNWSEIGEFTTDKMTDLPPIPVIKGPLNGAKDINTANLSFYASLTATEYEIELIDEVSLRYFGTRDYNIIKTTETSVSIDIYEDRYKYRFQTDCKLYWRVRAKNSAGYSLWSKYHTFEKGVKLLRAYPNDQAVDIPTNTVFSWESSETHVDRKTELQVSTQKDFSANVISQQYAFNEMNKIGFSTFLGKGNLSLQPDTKYYYRV